MCAGEAVKQLMCWRASVASNAAKLEGKAERGIGELDRSAGKVESRQSGSERMTFFFFSCPEL